MKYSLAFAAIFGFLTFVAEPALSADAPAPQPNFGPEIRYKPEQRFAVPTNKATGLNNAKNVVIKEVSLSSLPEYMRIQADTLSETCTKDIENKKLLKFYRYTSDATRDNSVSASYLIDFAGWADKPMQTCVLGTACNKDGCMLVGYNSTAYEKWNQHFILRQKSWEHKNLEDSRLKTILTVFGLTTKCKGTPPADKKEDDGCPVQRIWLESGFVEYKNGGMLDNVMPFVDTPQEVPDAVTPSPEAAPAEAPAEVPAEAPAEQTE